MTKVRELEELQKKVDRLSTALTRAGEYELASQALEVGKKLQQKIDGHRAQKKRKK